MAGDEGVCRGDTGDPTTNTGMMADYITVSVNIENILPISLSVSVANIYI